MRGGVGRYTFNLVRALRSKGSKILVACNKEGDGDWFGLAPTNDDNYQVLLNMVDKIRPDIVHIQYEHGLYGLVLDSFDPDKTRTNIDLFYDKCSVPIVTTFHTSFNFKQWMAMVVPIKSGKSGKIGRWRNKLLRYWAHFFNYQSFHDLNRRKLRKSAGSIVFSEYMKNKVGGGIVVYHGAESAIPFSASKEQARSRFSLPQKGRIALAVGFRTATKGWDIFKKMNIPPSWTIVINSSKNHYNLENLKPGTGHSKIINLDMDFLNDTELSLLFHAADVVLLPYKVSSGSGVMFDGLAHGLPFLASDLEFFREFSSMGLGITVKRNPKAFVAALIDLDSNYSAYSKAVETFKNNIKWDNVADMHINLYENIMRNSLLHEIQKTDTQAKSKITGVRSSQSGTADKSQTQFRSYS
jgi:glycosyltransferase involved in cell wall biosynthesis